MSTADEIAGQIPTVVAAGVTMKVANAMLGTQKRSPRIRRAKKSGKRLSRYSPF